MHLRAVPRIAPCCRVIRPPSAVLARSRLLGSRGRLSHMSAQPKISRAGFSAPGAVTSSPGLQSSRVVGQMANPVGNGVGLYRRDVLATNDLSEYVQIIERH